MQGTRKATRVGARSVPHYVDALHHPLKRRHLERQSSPNAKSEAESARSQMKPQKPAYPVSRKEVKCRKSTADPPKSKVQKANHRPREKITVASNTAGGAFDRKNDSKISKQLQLKIHMEISVDLEGH